MIALLCVLIKLVIWIQEYFACCIERRVEMLSTNSIGNNNRRSISTKSWLQQMN